MELLYINVLLQDGQQFNARWITDTVDGMEVIRLDTKQYQRLYLHNIQSAYETNIWN